MNNRAMKDSGVEWMEEIPSHWEVSKVKNLATEKNTVFLDGDWIESEFITNSGVRLIQTGNIGVGFYKEQGFRYITEETFEILNCRYIEAGDLLISRLAGPVGRSCLAPKLEEKMICSVDICSLRPNENIDPKFLNFHFTAKGHLEYCSLIARGATLQRISRKQLGNVAVVIPPLHEQQAIATYLDEKVSNLDQLIKDQQRVIEEWKAYKQSLITETVTKGLNPEVAFKNSGIEWIGEIPSHWEVRFLKSVGDAITGLTYSPSDIKEDGILVLRSTNIVNGKIISNDKERNVYIDKNISKKLMTVAGDILICSRNGSPSLVGKNALIDVKDAGVTFGAFTTVFRSKYSKYIYYLLNSELLRYHIGSFSTTTINQLTIGQLNKIKVTFPPFHEQQQIANFLDDKCSKIDQLIEDKQRLIEELKTYKQSLIYECVTGKKEIV